METIKASEVKLSNIEMIESNLMGLLSVYTDYKFVSKKFITDRVSKIKSLAKKTPRAELRWLWDEWKDVKELSALGKKTLMEAVNASI